MSDTPTPPQAEKLSERRLDAIPVYLEQKCFMHGARMRLGSVVWVGAVLRGVYVCPDCPPATFSTGPDGVVFAAPSIDAFERDRDAWKARAEKAEAELAEANRIAIENGERAEAAEAEVSRLARVLNSSRPSEASEIARRDGSLSVQLAASRARVSELEQCLRQTGPIAFAELQAREEKLAKELSDSQSAASRLSDALSTTMRTEQLGPEAMLAIRAALSAAPPATACGTGPDGQPGCGAPVERHAWGRDCPAPADPAPKSPFAWERPSDEKVAAAVEHGLVTRAADESFGERPTAVAPVMHLPAQMEELHARLERLRGFLRNRWDETRNQYIDEATELLDEILRLVPVAHDDAQGGKAVPHA